MTKDLRNPEPPDRLVPILARYFNKATEGFEEWLDQDRLISPPSANDMLDSADNMLEACCCEIEDELGRYDLFEGPEDLADYLSTYLGEYNDQEDAFSGDPSEAFLRAVALHLRGSGRTHAFELPFLSLSPQGYEGILGGPRNLQIRCTEEASGQFRHQLAGQVTAATVGGAVRNAQGCTEEVAGAALALNIATLVYAGVKPPSSPVIRILSHPTASEVLLHPESAHVVSRLMFHIPRELTDLEAAQVRQGNSPAAAQRATRALARLMSDASARGEEVRNAARLYLQAKVSTNYGSRLVHSFMCVEGLLLERTHTDNVQARLAEAVTYRIGTSAENRQELRRQIKRAYEDRSTYIHTGMVRGKGNVYIAHVEVCRRVLEKEITDLEGSSAGIEPLVLRVSSPADVTPAP